eukprot:3340874-Amphidinium_carterae.1
MRDMVCDSLHGCGGIAAAALAAVSSLASPSSSTSSSSPASARPTASCGIAAANAAPELLLAGLTAAPAPGPPALSQALLAVLSSAS